MITNSQLAEKVYEALEEKCEEFKDYNPWADYLKRNDIIPRDFDDARDAADDLVEMVNEGTDRLLCFDPFPSVVKSRGGYQFLLVPKELAEKIAVLGAP
jgi:hypothetical protein